MIKKISNFFTNHQGLITIISLIFIYLGSLDIFNKTEITLIKIITLIAGVVLVIGICINPFVRAEFNIKSRDRLVRESKNATKT